MIFGDDPRGKAASKLLSAFGLILFGGSDGEEKRSGPIGKKRPCNCFGSRFSASGKPAMSGLRRPR
jgi:hypothetical protein